jgi:hypothetical protein
VTELFQDNPQYLEAHVATYCTIRPHLYHSIYSVVHYALITLPSEQESKASSKRIIIRNQKKILTLGTVDAFIAINTITFTEIA